MKSLLILLICLSFVSCIKERTVQVLSTREKVEIVTHPYVVGDTITLFKTALSRDWAMDVNWVYMRDTFVITDHGSVVYRQAAIIE